jgi:hypothetical protein
MPQSTAFSAQGTLIQVGTATGSAVNFSAITATKPAIVTSAAHGLSNGDVVTVAGVVGTMSALNGQTFVVTNASASTFVLHLSDTTGQTYTSGGSATPVTWTTINNIKSFSGFDGMASEIDVTNLSSTAKEKRLGIQDFGAFKFDINPDYNDAGQNALRSAKAAAAIKNFKVAYPNGKAASFSAFVKGMPEQGGVDAVLAGSVDLMITGAVVVA